MKIRTPKQRRDPRAAAEDGWTLIELLIGLAMMLAIFFAALPIIDGAANTEGKIETAAVDIGDARAFSERVLRDLRSSYAVNSYSSTDMSVNTYVRTTSCGSGVASPAGDPPTQCQVSYACSGGKCTRTEAQPDGSGAGPAQTVITGLSDDSIFSWTGSGDQPVLFVGVRLVLPNQQGTPGDAITLQDGTALRNVGAA